MRNLLGAGHFDDPLGELGIAVAAHIHVGAVAQLDDDLRCIAGTGMGHVHSDGIVGLHLEAGRNTALEAGLLLGGGADHHVDSQRLALQQIHGVQQAHQTGTVVKGLAAQSVALQLHGIVSKGHIVAHANHLFCLLAGHTDVHHHFGDGHRLLVVAGLLEMGRDGRHNAQNRAFLGEHGQLAAQQHPLIHAAHGGEPQEAFLGDLGDEKSDLVDMGIQHNGFCAGDAAVPVAQHVAEVVDLHPVTVGRHHFRSDLADPELVARHAVSVGEFFDFVCQSQSDHTSFQ